jgi:hypothetical protein
MKLSTWGASAFVVALLSGCTDPAQIRAENHASDRQRCTDYGYQEGTDAFANCMERSDAKREREQERTEDRKARMRELALKRSGDERYAICSAATPNVELDVEGFWYAEGCRAR